MPRDFEHLLRMGTQAEKDYFRLGSTLYDTLVLNANLVEASPSSTAIFVAVTRKPFVIDPVTYAFALSPRLLLSARPRKEQARPARATFVALASAFALPAELVGKRELSPRDFNVPTRIGDFTDAVYSYQRSRLVEALENDSAFLFDDAGDRVGAARPRDIVVPYFVDDLAGTWRQLNLQLLRTVGQSPAEGYAGVLAFQSRLSTQYGVAQLALDYGDSPTRRMFVWPTDLDEHAAPVSLLRDYAYLISQLASAGKSPISAYGGFFALLLAFRGMSGVTHGVGYGDKRDLEPVVGGGLPPARYYVRGLRDSVGMGEVPVIAEGLSDDEFRERVCNCVICDALLNKGGVAGLVQELTETELRRTPTKGTVEVATARVYRMARFHFLANRADEVAFVRQAVDWDDVARQVRSEAQWVGDRLGSGAVGHIDRWLTAANPAETGW
jgi:hypothetical protein